MHASSVISDFVTLWTVAHQAPLFMVFSRHEYWNKLPFPIPGDLPYPEIEPASLIVSCTDRWILDTWEAQEAYKMQLIILQWILHSEVIITSLYASIALCNHIQRKLIDIYWHCWINFLVEFFLARYTGVKEKRAKPNLTDYIIDAYSSRLYFHPFSVNTKGSITTYTLKIQSLFITHTWCCLEELLSLLTLNNNDTLP